MRVWVQTTSVAVFAACLVLAGCTRPVIERRISSVSAAQSLVPVGNDPILKAHMRDGQVYVLRSWTFNESTRNVTGTGGLYDINRDSVGGGNFTVPYDSVALVETNVVSSRSSAVGGLTVLTGASVVLGVYCITNPKACFGSCPTFYAWDGQMWCLQAEGFSSSIAPALERTDVDLISPTVPRSRSFVLQVRNEAIETHVIRSVDILAVPRAPGMRVFKTEQDSFYLGRIIGPPAVVISEDGEVTGPVSGRDGVEYFSKADSTNLASRETLEMVFQQVPAGPIGIVVACRQTLMTTFLLYQGLAYMGQSAGHWLAELERKGPEGRALAEGCGNLLGFIDVLEQEDDGEWTCRGTLGEVGPIATDETLVLLQSGQSSAGTLKLRLRLTRGYWRIDQIILVSLGPPVTPLRVRPQQVTSLGNDELPAGTEWDLASSPLLLLPGDAYALSYVLPENQEGLELFLSSRGYYLEWIRGEWLAEENPEKVSELFLDPAGYLRDCAPAFTKAEPTMEEAFWNSRIARIP